MAGCCRRDSFVLNFSARSFRWGSDHGCHGGIVCTSSGPANAFHLFHSVLQTLGSMYCTWDQVMKSKRLRSPAQVAVSYRHPEAPTSRLAKQIGIRLRSDIYVRASSQRQANPWAVILAPFQLSTRPWHNSSCACLWLARRPARPRLLHCSCPRNSAARQFGVFGFDLR